MGRSVDTHEHEKKSHNEGVDTCGFGDRTAENHVGTECTCHFGLTSHTFERFADRVTFTDSGTDRAKTHTKTCTECSCSSNNSLFHNKIPPKNIELFLFFDFYLHKSKAFEPFLVSENHSAFSEGFSSAGGGHAPPT
jgi:hypothetical protein